MSSRRHFKTLRSRSIRLALHALAVAGHKHKISMQIDDRFKEVPRQLALLPLVVTMMVMILL
jgi:hypothetical protein